MFPCQPIADRLSPKAGSGAGKEDRERRESRGEARLKLWGWAVKRMGGGSALQRRKGGSVSTRNEDLVNLVVLKFIAKPGHYLPHPLHTQMQHSNHSFFELTYTPNIFKGTSCNLRNSNQFISYSLEIKIGMLEL